MHKRIQEIQERLRAVPIAYRMLGVIILAGIFFRVYNFAPWLRFNSDQARDASVVRSMVEEGIIPLLGPVAGGTAFKLGPIFYYFQYLSAKIFGVSPDVMAYPDLLFGIMAIPLIYFLLRRYFTSFIALSVAALYAVSFFAIQYSRFAWNPNSAPFFSMLFVYSILRLSDTEEGRKRRWILLAGISLGVGMQLHTLLLFGMPFAFLILSAYLMKKNDMRFFQVILISVFALVVHSPQIVSEIRTGGGNFLAFRDALVDKGGKQNPLWENALFVVSCQVQANLKILIPSEDQEMCPSPFSEKYFQKLDKENNGFSDWVIFAGKFILAVGFSGIGYFLWCRSMRIEADRKRRKDLWTLALFSGSMLLVFIPFGAEVSLRYFILLTFIPFVLLGFIIETILHTRFVCLKRLVFLLISVLALYNVFFSLQAFQVSVSGVSGSMIDGSMKQAEDMMAYIAEQSGYSKKIQIGGQKVYVGRFIKRISYFSKDFGIEIVALDKNNTLDIRAPLFVAFDGTLKKCERGSPYKGYGKIESCRYIDGVILLKMIQN